MDSGKFIINQGHVSGQCIGDNQQITVSFGDEPIIDASQYNQASFAHKATATTQQLASADGVSVQCCLPDGNVVFVPLNEIFKLFEKKLVQGI